MKKLKIIMISISVICLFSTNVFAQNNKVPITIEDKTSVVEIDVIKTQNVPDWCYKTLANMGYEENEIKNFSKNDILHILKQRLDYKEIDKNKFNSNSSDIQVSQQNYIIDDAGSVTLFAFNELPSNYTAVVNPQEPNLGKQYFHPKAGINDRSIFIALNGAEITGRFIYNQSVGLKTYHYLWGEYDTGWGTHQGVDLVNLYDQTSPVRSPIAGTVSFSSISKKQINIASSTGKTVNLQHLSNIDGLEDLAEGKRVALGQYLGNQNTTDQHIHLQACAHSNCTVVHSHNQDPPDLVTISPYNLVPEYK